MCLLQPPVICERTASYGPHVLIGKVLYHLKGLRACSSQWSQSSWTQGMTSVASWSEGLCGKEAKGHGSPLVEKEKNIVMCLGNCKGLWAGPQRWLRKVHSIVGEIQKSLKDGNVCYHQCFESVLSFITSPHIILYLPLIFYYYFYVSSWSALRIIFFFPTRIFHMNRLIGIKMLDDKLSYNTETR